MLKSLGVLILLTGASAYASPSSCNSIWSFLDPACWNLNPNPKPPTTTPGPARMPETNSIPELLVGVGAVSVIVWRMRGQSQKLRSEAN